jgi:hypothetical protein
MLPITSSRPRIEFCSLLGSIDYDGAARCNHSRVPNRVAGRRGWRIESNAVFVFVQIVAQVGRRIVPADADIPCVKHLAQFVADQINNPLKVEFGSKPFLDAVNDRQLGIALARFFDRSGAVQRRRDVLSDEIKHSQIRVGVPDPRLVALDDDEPFQPLVYHERHA